MNWKNGLLKLQQTLMLAFFGLFSLGQLQRWQLDQVAVYGLDVVVVGVVTSWFFSNVKIMKIEPSRVKSFLKKNFLSVLLMTWVGLALLVNVVTGQSITIPVLYVLRLIFYTIFTYVIINQIKWPTELQTHFKPYHSALALFVYAGLFVLYFGFLQYVLVPDTRFLTAFGWDDHYYRLISTLFDPAFTGAILVLTWAAGQHFFQSSRLITKLVVNSCLMLGLALTFSRSSYLALGVAALALVGLSWWRERRWQWQPLGWLIIFTVFIFLIPKPSGEGVNLLRTSTVDARVNSISDVVTVVRPYQWLVGRGLFMPLPELQAINERDLTPDHAQVPDNLFVFLVSGMGLVGVGLLTLIIVQNWRFIYRLPTWFQVSALAVLVSSLFNNTLFQPFIWLWMTGMWWIARLEFKRDR